MFVISRGIDKEELARELGAHDYIESEKEDPAKTLKALGGAKVIPATAPKKVVSSLIDGLGLPDRQKKLIVKYTVSCCAEYVNELKFNRAS